jgi:dipeptide/tripeptide permease
VLQNSVPNDLRGAVTGLYLSTYVGTLPLSQLLGGALAQHMAVETAFSAMAAGLLMGSLVIYVPRWIKLGRIEIDADRI